MKNKNSIDGIFSVISIVAVFVLFVVVVVVNRDKRNCEMSVTCPYCHRHIKLEIVKPRGDNIG